MAAALISARQDIALASDTVVFGEISLSGALRPISQGENRLKEAQKLGFSTAFAPSRMKTSAESCMKVESFEGVDAFVERCFGAIDA